jgi:hypothetical protein
MYVPIAMSMDPASVSTSCDDLLAGLNAQRSDLLGNEVAISQIMQLEDVSVARTGLGTFIVAALSTRRLTTIISSAVPRPAKQQTRNRLLG